MDQSVHIINCGALEVLDKDEILDAVEIIQKESKKLEKATKGAAKKLKSNIKEATGDLLRVAFGVLGRPQPEARPDYGKPRMDKATRQVARALFVFLDNYDLRNTEVQTFDRQEFQRRLQNFVEALRNGAANMHAQGTSATPALKDESARCVMEREADMLEFGRSMSWASPILGSEREEESEDNERNEDPTTELQWPYKVDLRTLLKRDDPDDEYMEDADEYMENADEYMEDAKEYMEDDDEYVNGDKRYEMSKEYRLEETEDILEANKERLSSRKAHSFSGELYGEGYAHCRAVKPKGEGKKVEDQDTECKKST